MTNPIVTREDRVEEFVDANPLELTEQVVWECFDEEVSELFEAGLEYKAAPCNTTRAAFIKELADVQYTLSQIAVRYQVNLQKAFDRVADSNMSKVVEGELHVNIKGKPWYNKSLVEGKVLKGPNYVAPDMSGL